MLEAIKSSKFFLVSKNQDRILPVLCSTLGKELVQQLSSYLDDDSVITKSEYEAQKLASEEPATDMEAEFDEPGEGPAEESGGADTPPSPSSHVPAPSGNSSFSEGPSDFDEDGSSEDEEPSAEPAPSESGDVAESRRFSGRRILATAGRFTISETKITQVANEILGLLNSRQETCGVSRVVYQGDNSEIWVHYNDKTNLNNVLDLVLDLLNVSGYYYLKFSRLARSDNAIVLDLNVADISELGSNGK